MGLSSEGFEKLVELRPRARCFRKRVVLTSEPTALWPYLSNTDEMNRLLKMGTISYEFLPREAGGSTLVGEKREAGLKWRYIELPFDWVKPSFLGVERVLLKGPFQYVKWAARLEKTHQGTQVEFSLSIVPKIWTAPFLTKIAEGVLNQFTLLARRIDERLVNQGSNSGFRIDLSPSLKSKIEELTIDWSSLSDDPAIPQLLAEYVHTASDQEVAKMRPYSFATEKGLPKRKVLEFFLKASRSGFLNLSWDVLCTSCQGAKQRTSELKDLNASVHCESCSIDYRAEFDKNVEVTFSPTEKVRKFITGDFCFGSPANTERVIIQKTILPGESTQLEIDLNPGRYRWGSLQVEDRFEFEVNETTDSFPAQFILSDDLKTNLPKFMSTSSRFELENHREEAVTFKLELVSDANHIVTAHELTTLQDFRDLFGSEVLRPGIEVAVSNLVVLFSDLKDSTAMYDSRGDASAFALVQHHFEIMLNLIRSHHGAIVKTIGDAVMAVFTQSESAVAASIDVLEAFHHWNRENPDHPVLLKLGIHQGPCIALNSNDQLDYFGATVNKAARVQGVADGEELVLSEDVFLDLGTQRALESANAEVVVTNLRSDLKGIKAKSHLFRVSFEFGLENQEDEQKAA